MDKRAERTQITQDMVINELALLGFSNMADFTKWGNTGVTLKESSELTKDQTACILEVSETTSKDGGSIKFKLHDKKGALELLGRHLKLFTDKVEQSNPGMEEILKSLLGEIDQGKSSE